MKFVLPYKLFEEAKLRDDITFVNHPDALNYLAALEVSDDNLLKMTPLDRLNNTMKVNFYIDYNHTSKHDLLDRIDKRADKTIGDFNKLFKVALNEFYPEHLNLANLKGDRNKRKISIYFNDKLSEGYTNGFSIVYTLSYRGLSKKRRKKEEYDLYVKTVLNGHAHTKYLELIYNY